jgi:NADPH2:quinone reductase
MKAIAFETFGGPEQLQFLDLPAPEPGPGEVRVRMAWASVNPADWKSRAGWLQILPIYKPTFPLVPGLDGAGIIEKLGPGVSGPPPGTRVFVRSHHSAGKWGTYAEFAVTTADYVAEVPAGVSLADAATVPTAALAAWDGIVDTGGIQPGQTVLVSGAAGAVGCFAIQFAKAAGARVAGTCSAGNIDYVLGLGADAAIDYRGDIAAGVRRFAPEGVDLVYDAVSSGTLLNGPDLARPGGRYVHIQTLDPDETLPDAAAAAKRDVAILPSTIKRDGVATRLPEIARLMSAGKVRPPVAEIYPLARAADAHRRLEAGGVRGKLLLKIGD